MQRHGADERRLLGAGDRVAVLLQRGAEAAAAFFGVLASGAIAVTVNESLRFRQIEHILYVDTAQNAPGALPGRVIRARQLGRNNPGVADRLCGA